MKAYKLFRKMKDGSLAPLFINKRQRLEIGVQYRAGSHRTPGYAYRPGWHSCQRPTAPHLSEKGRVWCEVDIDMVAAESRPMKQGGTWYISHYLTVVKELSDQEVAQIRASK